MSANQSIFQCFYLVYADITVCFFTLSILYIIYTHILYVCITICIYDLWCVCHITHSTHILYLCNIYAYIIYVYVNYFILYIICNIGGKLHSSSNFLLPHFQLKAIAGTWDPYLYFAWAESTLFNLDFGQCTHLCSQTSLFPFCRCCGVIPAQPVD